MPPGGEDQGGHRRAAPLLLAASERLYGALLALYPEAFRRRYADEMRRDFGELSREGLEEGGGKELAGLWAAAFSDLALTALEERGTTMARSLAQNVYLPARPAAVGRWGAVSALLGGATGTVAYCFLGPFPYLPLLVVVLFSALLSAAGLFGLYGTLAAASGRPGRLAAAGAALAAASAVSWLALGAFAALGLVLGWPAVPAWTSTPTHAALVAALGCWFAGLLLLAVASYRTRLPARLRVLPLALVAMVPVSLFVPAFVSVGMPLVTGLPFLGTALLGLALLRGRDAAADTAPNVATSAAAAPPRRPSVGPGTAGPTASAAQAAKEKELLGALARRGALTAAGAALATSLTVEEADRMLSALAVKGHLQVTVEHGRMLYSL